jgi:branched-chain amino acid transport system substrate-binding protein
MRRHGHQLALALLLLAVSLSGCSERRARRLGGGRPLDAAPLKPLIVSQPDVGFDGALRIASIFPSVGRNASSGVQSDNGAHMAADDVNRRGGIHGRLIKLMPYRTGSFFLDTRQAAELAAGTGGAVAIVGANDSALSAAIAEVAESRGIVQVSNVSTAEDLTWNPETGRERRFVFRVCASDATMGAALARFAEQQLGARRVAVLYEVGRSYSARLARNFIKRFQLPSSERVAKEFYYLPLEIDFRSQLKEIAAFDPDVLFSPGTATDATFIASQARGLGLRATLLGADGWSQRGLFSRAAPPDTAYFADLCSPPEPFVRRYQQSFNVDVEGCRPVLSYDAVWTLARALESMGPLSDADLQQGLARTRDRLRAQLLGVKVEGVSGRIRFGRHRDRVGGIAIMQVGRLNGDGFFLRFFSWADAS